MAASSYPTGSIELDDAPPRRAPTTVRPPSGVFTLEDRLTGVRGSMAPPSYAFLAMPVAAPPRSSRAVWLALALLAISGLTAVVVYRDMTREPATLTPTPP